MVFGKRKDWQDDYDEDYVGRADRRETIGRLRHWLHLLVLSLIGVLFLAGVGMVGGKTMIEKTLTSLASPTGLIWLGLILMIYFCLLLRQSWPAIMGVICWLLLTIFGNGFVANSLIHGLEAEFIESKPFEAEPYDMIFVLGGGTTTNLANRAQATAAGDRVITAARLYHAGKAKKIVCTGEQFTRTVKEDLHPYEEASQILIGLNVPQTAVSKIPGLNTSLEMQNAAKLISQSNIPDARIGIVTSAWHLRRALRLAKANGVEAEGIPADFLSQHYVPSPDNLIPSGPNLAISANAVKEYLAAIVGR